MLPNDKPTTMEKRAVSTVQLRLAMTDKERGDFMRMLDGRAGEPATLAAMRTVIQSAYRHSAKPIDRERLMLWWADFLFERLQSAKSGVK